MAAFPDSQQVYHQLRWDSRFSQEACGIVLVDRDGETAGTRTIAFRDFIPNGPIPWHRLVRFLYADQVLWDRQLRVDRRPALLAAERPAQQRPASLLEARALSAYRFSGGAWEADGRLPGGPVPRTWVTWNVLFDLYEPELLQSERRWPALLELLRRSEADVIALTEATPRFVALALAQPWVREAFSSSGLPDSCELEPHGTLVLARGGLGGLHAVRLEGRREALLARVGGAQLCAVHLKSDRRAPSRAERARDFARLAAHLRAVDGAGPCVLLGDLNAGLGELEPQLEALGALDAWAAVHPEDEGMTYDPAANALAAALSSSGKRGRLDRVLVLGGAGLRPAQATLLGREPVDGRFVSDHFGLRVELEPDDAALATAPTGHDSAVVLLPPRALWGPLQRLRARFDAQRFMKWPPHLSMLYGFLGAPLLPAAARVLAAELAGTAPFELVLDEAMTFTHRASATLALAPSAEGTRALRRVQARLLTRFPQCLEQNRGEAGAFTPHLTLGRFATAAAAAFAKREAAALLPLRFEVRELAVLERVGDELSVSHRVNFSGAVARGEEPVAARVAASGEATRREVSGAARVAASGEAAQVAASGEAAQGEASGVVLLEALVAEAGLHGARLEPFGTTRYAPFYPSDELDAALLLDAATPVEESLRRLEAVLDSRGFTRRRASPTFLRARLGERRFDLHLASLPAPLPVQPVGAWVEGLGERELQRTLLGPLDALALRARLERHGRTEAFDALFPQVRRWAKARGLEGNAFGYFGGLGWAVLTAAPLLHDEVLCADGSWSAWSRWASRLEDATVRVDLAAQLDGAGLRVCSPARPWRDVARALTPGTAAVLARELRRLPTDPRATDVRSELGHQLVFSGATDESLGVYQQRFLALLGQLDFLAPLRVVGRVDGEDERWVHAVGCTAPGALAQVREVLEGLGLHGVRVGSSEGHSSP
jgi:poly(A) polymerase